jgi:hypothetical protein
MGVIDVGDEASADPRPSTTSGVLSGRVVEGFEAEREGPGVPVDGGAASAGRLETRIVRSWAT